MIVKRFNKLKKILHLAHHQAVNQHKIKLKKVVLIMTIKVIKEIKNKINLKKLMMMEKRKKIKEKMIVPQVVLHQKERRNIKRKKVNQVLLLVPVVVRDQVQMETKKRRLNRRKRQEIKVEDHLIKRKGENLEVVLVLQEHHLQVVMA